MCFDSSTGSPASSRNETSGCISITRSSTSASVCTSRIFLPSANACWEMPLPVIVRAISFASANVRASSAARGGVGKTLLARLPPTKARAAASAARDAETGRVDRDVDGDHAAPRSESTSAKRRRASRPGRRRSGRARPRPSPCGSRRHRRRGRSPRLGPSAAAAVERGRDGVAEAELDEPREGDVHRLGAVERDRGDRSPRSHSAIRSDTALRAVAALGWNSSERSSRASCSARLTGRRGRRASAER